MDPFRSKAKNVWFTSATGTTAATATAATAASTRRVVTHVSGSSDAAGLVTLTWVDQAGTTQTWKKRFSAAYTFSEVFPPGEINANGTGTLSVTISAGTSNCEVQFGGYLTAG